ncbi:MAG: acyltransferase [Candidatus Hodarchaeota archaeon]
MNRIYQKLAMFLPGSHSVRPFLHKLRGVTIHGKVFIGDQVYIDNEYPECVEIGDETQIGIRTMILAHFRAPGRIVIGKQVWIGPNCVISTSEGRTLTIGDGAVIGASSVITFDIPPGIFVCPEKPKPIAKVTVPLTENTEYKNFMRGLIPLRKKKNI